MGSRFVVMVMLLSLVQLVCPSCGPKPDRQQRELSASVTQLEKERGWYVLVTSLDDISYLSLAERRLVSLYSRGNHKDLEWVGGASVSPDATKLTFAVSAYADSYSLIVLDLVTKREQAIARMSHLFGPRWSPSGRRIAFKGVVNNHLGLDLYDLGRNETTVLVAEGVASGDGGLAWAPNDTRLAYLTESLDVEIVDVATKARYKVGRGYAPSWSHDGKYIAYLSYDRHAWVFHNLQTDQKEMIPVTDVGGDLVWSPDDRYVAYCGLNPGLWSRLGDLLSLMNRCGELWVMDVETKARARIFGAGSSLYPTDWAVIRR